jgi:hypothetical protein
VVLFTILDYPNYLSRLLQPVYDEPNLEEEMALRVGQSAPNFTLENHLDGKTSLHDYLGKKNVVLAFFPLAWTPI